MTPLISIPQYARARGVHLTEMRQSLYRVGLRGRIDPVEADKRLEAAKSLADKNDDKNDDGSTAYAEAERRLKWARAAQEELKLQKIQGTLVLRAAVTKTTFDMIRRARDRFQNIPARLSGPLAAERDQAKIFAVLTKEIQQALEDLS